MKSIGLALHLAFSAAALAAESGFTPAETVNNALFPVVQLERKFTRPTEDEERRLASFREINIRLMKAAGEKWLSAISGDAGRVSAARIFPFLDSPPFWICEGDCPCGSSGSLGCVSYRQAGDALGTIILIKRCLLTGDKCGPNVQGGGTQLFMTLREALNKIAVAKAIGISDRGARDKTVERSLGVLKESSAAIIRTMESCPGPFPEAGFRALTDAGDLRPINAFVEECAVAQFGALLRAPEVAACKRAIDPGKWKTVMTGGLLAQPLVVRRCDGICQWVTCLEKKADAPTLLKFGSKWVVSVPEGACEGASATRAADWARMVLAHTATRVTETEDCIRALVGRGAAPVRVSPPLLDEGPEVQLVE